VLLIRLSAGEHWFSLVFEALDTSNLSVVKKDKVKKGMKQVRVYLLDSANFIIMNKTHRFLCDIINDKLEKHVKTLNLKTVDEEFVSNAMQTVFDMYAVTCKFVSMINTPHFMLYEPRVLSVF
jgi:CRISPR/Cas system type I-B associated protein Csh2 (Cas7 group RAMP superfamily)